MKKNETKSANSTNWYLIAQGYAKKFNISLEEILKIFAFEATKAINRDIDPDAEILFELDEENQEIFTYNINGEVVEDSFEFDDISETQLDIQRITFIKLSDAKKVDKKAKEGDTGFKVRFEFSILPDKTKLSIKNGFYQNLRNTEKRNIVLRYTPLIGQKLKAEVLTKNSNGSYNLKFEDGVTAFLPANKVNRLLEMTLGSHIDVYLESVNEDNKLSICQVSTDSANQVRDIALNEIPEISQGLLEIVKIERIPGVRTKIALKSTPLDVDFDAFGSVFGEGARRILAISEKLGGEKIDVIKWFEDKKEFIRSALSPAKIIDVVEDKKGYFVIVANDEMKNAIGKRGINIDLASKITGTKIKILSPEEATEKEIEFTNSNKYEKPLIGHKKREGSHKELQRIRFFENIDIDMSEFSKDVAQFAESQTIIEEAPKVAKPKPVAKPKVKEEEIDALFSEENIAIELDDINEHFDYDFIDQINFEEEAEEQNHPQEQETQDQKESKAVKAYKNAKIEIKDFKVDNDLANYGLDFNLDLSGFEEQWEDDKK